jgi:hypothetical protein
MPPATPSASTSSVADDSPSRTRRARVDSDRRLLELAGRQHYVVARGQLREFGTERQIDHRLKRGRLERVHEGVYRVVGSPNTWRQRLLAACLASSGANAASFRAGLRLWDLPAGEEIVEVTAPRHRRMQIDGVTIHESFFLTDLDVTYIDGIPVTRPARLLCDLALLVERGELRPHVYELTIQEAIRRNLVDIPRLWREWERLGGAWRPGGRTVAAVLKAYVPPIRQTETTPETRLLQLIRAAGLPEPVPQFRVALSPTRKARLDFAWPDEKVYCEFDPYKWHGGRDHYMYGATRRLRLEALGWRGVPVTDDELDSGGRLATQLLLQRLPRAG